MQKSMSLKYEPASEPLHPFKSFPRRLAGGGGGGFMQALDARLQQENRDLTQQVQRGRAEFHFSPCAFLCQGCLAHNKLPPPRTLQ